MCLLKDQNHYLLRLLHGETTGTITHLQFWLELHPLGSFCSSLLVMGVEQVIQEDLLLHFCRLVVPPGAKVKYQLAQPEVKKTKEEANLRIHVKRAINRITFFRILKGKIPVKMIQHVDDIILTCAALCNLKPKLSKTKEKDLQK